MNPAPPCRATAVDHIPGFVISGYYSAGGSFGTPRIWSRPGSCSCGSITIQAKSLFSMALCHWTFGLFWSLWPQDNLQRAVPFYRPQITAAAAILYVLIVVYLWGPKTLARFRFGRPERGRRPPH